jgi:hypothetical protein
MNKQNKETVQERIEGYAWEEESTQVGQLDHENDGEPDFAELAVKLEERKQKEARGENDGHVKMTIYVEENLAKSFNALITKRGQQKQFINQAIRDFVQKKAKELGL